MEIMESEANYLKDFTGVILAGGRSSRFGAPKARIIFRGKPLIEHVLSAFSDIFANVMIIAGETDDVLESSHSGVPVIQDILPGRGPLGGIHTALVHSKTGYIFVTACDQPFVAPGLVRAMAKEAPDCDALVPRTAPLLFPLFACYSMKCLAGIEKQLAGGMLQVRGFYPEVLTRFADREWLERYDPLLHSLFNINTQADFENAFRIATEQENSFKSAPSNNY